MKKKRLLVLAGVLMSAFFLFHGESAELFGNQENQERPLVYVLDVEGSINPAVADYVMKGIEKAETNKASCVLIRLDTPGGLVTTTKSIIKNMINARIPVVVYVAPSGSSAASAGALITMGADVAAMAPGTNIGAAHPVGGSGEDIGGTMSDKIVNDLTAYMRGVVSKKGRNIDWAEKAIRESVSITASEALDLKVIDFVADSIPDLLSKLQGRRIEKEGTSYVLNTKDARQEKIPTGWRFKILDVVATPNIALILMGLGTIGIITEIYNPGSMFPGVVGAICLLLGLFAMQVLPVNYVGLLLIVLAMLFFVLELKIVSHGLFAIGGIISLTLGSIMLFESDEAALRVSWTVIVPMVATISFFFIFVLGLAVKARLGKPRTGDIGLIGEVGIALTDLNDQGRVAIHGEFWNARADRHIPSGERVRVIRVDNLMLIVTRDAGA
jgi:membrane-bound serine protease (ClpP class)